MSINFDDLLKKGKGKVSSNRTKEDEWKGRVGAIIHLVHQLNDMYGPGKKHNIQLDPKSCSRCGKPTFILTVRGLKSPHKPMHFHKSDWVHIDSKYHCETCKDT